jgi:ribose/xylose/arabinose/galactoside ABC-type transport system permease subunit
MQTDTRRKFDWKTLWKKLGPFIGLAFTFSLFSVLRYQTFLSAINLQIMLLQTAVVATGALGMTIIIISGGIDLSVGSVVALSTVVVAILMNIGIVTDADGNTPVPGALHQFLAALGGVGIGVASGFVTSNLVIGQLGRVFSVILAVGVSAWLSAIGTSSWVICLVALACLSVGLLINELFLKDREFNKRLSLIPFIATLGMMGAIRGCAHWMADNGTVNVLADTDQLAIKRLLQMPPADSHALLPTGVWMVLALAAVVAFVLRYTRFGRHVFALGSNERTARLCGIEVERTKLLVYMIGVGFAGLAGVMQFAYLGMGDSTTAPGMELNIIAAVVIGGGSLNGGEGSVVGSIIGALIMTVVANGCTKMGLESYVQEIVTGAIIIAAVLLDRLRHGRVD